MNALLVLKVLDIILLGGQLVGEARASAEVLADRLRALGGRDPTPEEWAEIDSETDLALANLKARAEAARSGR